MRRTDRHRIDQARLIGARARLHDLQGRRPAADPVLIDETSARSIELEELVGASASER